MNAQNLPIFDRPYKKFLEFLGEADNHSWRATERKQ